jgi:hypothetical protein
VVGETVTSALTLDESVLWHEDFATAAQYVMSPPIRAKHHQQPLQNALASGVLSLVGTGAAAYSEAHVANRDARVSARGDRKRVLERGTNPYLSRRACTCEYGLQSWRGESAGVAKRPREPHLPPEIPTVTIRHFASLYVSPIRNKPRVRRRGLPCSRHPFPTALWRWRGGTASDHAVFNSTQKAVGRPPAGDFRLIPNGVNGIEERLHMVWHTMVNSGKMSPSQFVAASCTVAAQVR